MVSTERSLIKEGGTRRAERTHGERLRGVALGKESVQKEKRLIENRRGEGIPFRRGRKVLQRGGTGEKRL